MELHAMRSNGDTALREAATAYTVEQGLSKDRRTNCAEVYVAHVGQTKQPMGIVQKEEQGVQKRWVSHVRCC
jgi:hypothetical protein